MWALVLTFALVQNALAAPTAPAAPETQESADTSPTVASGVDLQLVSNVLAELGQVPASEAAEDSVSPDLLELYRDVDILWEAQNSNLSESREGRGLLSKLSFITGLKLGSILTGSGTLAASQSINFLGKVLNAALSVSYGSLGTYPGGAGYPIPGGYPYPGTVVGGVRPIVGVQKLPTIQENVPPDENKRERPDDPSAPGVDNIEGPPSAEAVRKEFLRNHNQRVELFNDAFGKKVNARTGRIEKQKLENIT